MMMTWAQQSRALNILHNMALVHKRPLWAFWTPRFYIHHEPLRHDAGNLVRELNYQQAIPLDVTYIWEED